MTGGTDGLDQVRAALSDIEEVELPAEMRAVKSKVTPMRADPAKLKPRAKGLLDAVEFAGDIVPSLETNYLIKGLINSGCISILFGPSNTGKSFFALWIAHVVSKGGLQFFGRKVQTGRVLYIAAEGGAAIRNRVAALPGAVFWLLTVPLTLTGRDSAGPALAEMVQHLAATGGPFSLIIVDTMARVMGEADENAAKDIADLVLNLGRLVRSTGAHVMVVHHTGKDTARGARGHSALRAAIDTEIELSRDDDTGIISASVTKQRDGQTGLGVSFRLHQVVLGEDPDGDPVTTCVVHPLDSSDGGRGSLSDAAAKALTILSGLLAASGEVRRSPAYPGTPAVPFTAWREACLAEGAVSAAKDREGRARTFNRVRSDLEALRLVLVRDDLVWEVEP